MIEEANDQVHVLEAMLEERIGRLKRGDELAPGVLKLVKGVRRDEAKAVRGRQDRRASREQGSHRQDPAEEDMPYLPDGTPVEVVLNPLGVPRV